MSRLPFIAAALTIVGCGDPLISAVSPTGQLTAPHRHASGWTGPDTTLLRVDFGAISTPNRFAQLQAGTWCFQVRTPLASRSRCLTVAETASAEKNEHPFDTLLVPARRGDPVWVEVVGKLHRSASTEQAARVAAFVGQVVAAAGPADLASFKDVVGGAVGLAGGESGSAAMGQAWQFQLGGDCSTAACVGVLGDETELALTFGLSARDRPHVRVSEGRLVNARDEPEAVPLVLLRTSVTPWDDQLLSLDCRRDWATASVRDGKELACVDAGLDSQAPRLHELKRIVDAVRVRGASDEDLALAALRLDEWATDACGASLPSASAPCALAHALHRHVELAVPEAEALGLALRAAEALSGELSALALASDACAAVARVRPAYEGAEAAALRLRQCSEGGCVWPRLNGLREAAHSHFGNGVGACFVQRVAKAAETPDTSPAARVLLQSLTPRALTEGVTEAAYSPTAPPTAEALAEAISTVTRAEAGLPLVAPVAKLHHAFLNELNHLAQMDALITGGVKALQTLIARSLALAVAPIASSSDPYVRARIAHARDLSAEATTQTLFATTNRPGAPVFTPRARELLMEVVDLENEFVHLSATPTSGETAALLVVP